MNKTLRIFIVQLLIAIVMIFGEMQFNFPKIVLFIVVGISIEYMYSIKRRGTP